MRFFFTATLVLATSAQAQTPTTEQLKEALALEKKSDLAAAQAIYQGLVNDPDWAAAARLSLGRVQRWQYLHGEAIKNFEAVLSHPLATSGMRDEAHLGLAQIDAAEMRLLAARQRLANISAASPTAAQAAALSEHIRATKPTRISGSFGQVNHDKGSVDRSVQLRLTQQMDMRNRIELAYASNALEARTAAPDSALDYVKNQIQLAWHNQTPLGAAYSASAKRMRLNMGTDETSIEARGSWPISKGWAASAAAQRVMSVRSSAHSGSLGLSAALHANTVAGATVFASEAPNGTLYSWMLNTTWERGPWLAQWFVARSLDDSPVSNTLILRQRLNSGLTWRVEIKRDRNANLAFAGIDFPWGSTVVSTSAKRLASLTQWTTGFEHSLPNELERASASQP